MVLSEKAEQLRIVFMGTPDFAVASLDALVQAGCNIVGVITAPDKPAGRGMKINESPVKRYALTKGLTVLQPEKLKNPEFNRQLEVLKADIQIVVAFRMLPEMVWNMPRLGSVNVHASLLPQYRGAAPINWAVINGEKETGITTFKLAQDIDTGNILLQEKVVIGEDETAGELHDRLKSIGATLLLKTVQGLAEKRIEGVPQPYIAPSLGENMGSDIRHAPKIFTETCRINWAKDTAEVHNLVRGMSPFPGAFTQLDGKNLKIFRSGKEYGEMPAEPGSIHSDKKTFLKFACKDGYLLAKEIQAEGKKKMGIEEFLRGYR